MVLVMMVMMLTATMTLTTLCVMNGFVSIHALLGMASATYCMKCLRNRRKNKSRACIWEETAKLSKGVLAGEETPLHSCWEGQEEAPGLESLAGFRQVTIAKEKYPRETVWQEDSHMSHVVLGLSKSRRCSMGLGQILWQSLKM